MNKQDLILKWEKRKSLSEGMTEMAKKDISKFELGIANGIIGIFGEFIEDLQQLNEDIRVPPSESVSLPLFELAEELWDEHSEGIGSDISDLDFWAGRIVMERYKFIKAICSMAKGNALKP